MEADTLPEDEIVQECQGCAHEMDVWNAEKTLENGGDESLDVEGEIWIAWSPQDCRDALFFWCEDCKILQVSHKKCGTPLTLYGHQGYHRNGTQNYRDYKTGVKAVLSKPGKIDPKQPRFAVQDLMQSKVRLNEWDVCGPKNDMRHFWHCEECEQLLHFGRN